MGLTSPLRCRIVCVALLFLCLAGCRQQMADQPGFRPLQETTFFADKRSARPLVAGTVARGQLKDDVALYTGKSGLANDWAQAAGLVGAAQAPLVTLGLAINDPYVDTFPEPISFQMLTRGRERFNIFCSMCHDRSGTGEGMIVRRGFTRPPTFHQDRLRKAKAGYIFNVITRGFGAMPDYSSQIPVKDRWAIVAYVRALQLSQNASLADVPEEKKATLAEGNP